jgi:hypothetical protein
MNDIEPSRILALAVGSRDIRCVRDAGRVWRSAPPQPAYVMQERARCRSAQATELRDSTLPPTVYTARHKTHYHTFLSHQHQHLNQHVRHRLFPDAACSALPTARRYVTRPQAPAPLAQPVAQRPTANTSPVWVKKGICSADSLINICLCCLGVLPGLLHAWYIILQNPESNEHYRQVADQERGTTYYVVSHEQPGRHAQPSYGTVGSQPAAGQFPGQQSGGVGSFGGQRQKGGAAAKKGAVVPAAAQAGGEGSSGQPEGPPPAYADVISGDHKVQKP